METLYRSVFEKFDTEDSFLSCEVCNIGRINTTVFVKTTGKEYVLQRINTYVFKKPDEVMANIFAVTAHLRKKGVPTLTFLKTKEGRTYFEDESGAWRLALREAGRTYNEPTAELLERGARAFGRFQSALADFDATTLYETIPNFHNTPKRIEALWESVATAERERIANAAETVNAVRQLAAQGSYIQSLLDAGRLPVRVVHNDTKINNVLLGDDGVDVVLDLDTVMSGSLLYDFGDAIRSGASTRGEGSVDFEGFAVDLVRYEAFLKGYLSEVGKTITETERKLLPFSAFVLTYELAVRFLTDYLDGDKYFNVTYPLENLDRAKGQLALARHIFLGLDMLSTFSKNN